MLIKKMVRILAILSVSFSAKAQNMEDILSPKIIPPSPEAAALGKYGQHPVDMSTGVPSISVPLYEIKTPRLTLPISLSYHASGIKVDEIASWAGLGWSLNSGGVVTRTVLGLPDDWGGGILNHQLKKASEIQWPRDSTYLQYLAHGVQDGRPDQFFYNFNGYTGSLAFTTEGNPVLTPYKALKFTFNSGGFTVLDEHGVKYTFAVSELVQSSDAIYVTGVESSWYLTSIVSADLSDTIRLTYTTDDLDQVDISYNFTQNVGPRLAGGVMTTNAILWPLSATSTLRTYRAVRVNSIYFKGGKVEFVKKGGRLDNGQYSLDSIKIFSLNTSGQYTMSKAFKLVTDHLVSRISNPGPYLPSSGPTFYRLVLKGIEEIGEDNLVVKRHSFEYDPTPLPPVHNFGQDLWGFYNGHSGNKTLLQSKQIIGSDNGSVFTIGGTEGADRSVSPDHSKACILTRITYPTKGFTVFNFESNRSELNDVIRGGLTAGAVGYYQESSVVYYTPTAYNLQTGGGIFKIHIRKIGDIPYTMPVTPYIEIMNTANGNILYSAYAQNMADVDLTISLPVEQGVQYKLTAIARGGDVNSNTTLLPLATISTSFDVSMPQLAPIGGLRIASIQNFDSDSILLSSKTYTYGVNEKGGGSLVSASLMTNKVTHAGFVVPSHDGSECPGCFGQDLSVTIDTYFSRPIYSLSTVNGAPVNYSTVTEYEGDLAYNSGKTVYSYVSLPDSVLQCPRAYMAGVMPISVMWKNTGPIREAYYKHTGADVYALQKEKLTEYGRLPKPASRGLIGGYTYFTFTIDQYTYQYMPVSNFYWFDYPISAGVTIPTKEIINSYDSAGMAVLSSDTTNIFYENEILCLPTRIIKTDSKGNLLTNYLRRPLDKFAINALTPLSVDASQAIDSMIARHIISPVIQQAQYSGSNLTKLSLTNYMLWDSRIISPQNVQVKMSRFPLESRVRYNKYDKDGNVLEMQKPNDVKAVYLWGYQGRYPVAKISNTSYDVAKTYVNQSILDSPPNDAALRSELGKLRGLPNALVYTYTYKPSAAVSSETDPRGNISFYEYDAFGRLSNIKDKDGNIIRTYDYKYKQ